MTFSEMIIPGIVLGIILYGLYKKVSVYDAFVTGASGGLKTVAGVLPTLIGLMIAVGVLRNCGILDLFSKLGGPLASLAVIKMFSSSAAVGILLDIYKTYGVDSKTAYIASLMLSSTETIFYTMSVYFLSIEIRKTRWTLPGALIATVAGVVASVVLADIH